MRGMRLRRESSKAKSGALQNLKKKDKKSVNVSASAKKEGGAKGRDGGDDDDEDDPMRPMIMMLAGKPFIDVKLSEALYAALPSANVGDEETVVVNPVKAKSTSNKRKPLVAKLDALVACGIPNYLLFPISGTDDDDDDKSTAATTTTTATRIDLVSTTPPRRANRFTLEEHEARLEQYCAAHLEKRKKLQSSSPSSVDAMMHPVVHCGLEYGDAPFGEKEPPADPEVQKEWFALHVKFARSHDLPLMVTTYPSMSNAGTIEWAGRAMNDCLEVLRNFGGGGKLLFSNYCGTPAHAVEILKEFPGCLIGVSHALTFNKNLMVKEIVFDVPLDRTVAESWGAASPLTCYRLCAMINEVKRRSSEEVGGVLEALNANALGFFLPPSANDARTALEERLRAVHVTSIPPASRRVEDGDDERDVRKVESGGKGGRERGRGKKGTSSSSSSREGGDGGALHSTKKDGRGENQEDGEVATEDINEMLKYLDAGGQDDDDDEEEEDEEE